MQQILETVLITFSNAESGEIQTELYGLKVRGWNAGRTEKGGAFVARAFQFLLASSIGYKGDDEVVRVSWMRR